jgi:hypothetical protein
MTMTSRSDIRIAIGGWPHAGKTTLADRLGKRLGIPVFHTDDLIGKVSIEDASGQVAAWMLAGVNTSWIIEGVTATRGLRKWHQWDMAEATASMRMPKPPPCTHYVHLDKPFDTLTPRQAGMGRGTDTTLEDIRHWLAGVRCGEGNLSLLR